MNSLSKNMKTLLNNFEMYVIAQVSNITPTSTAEYGPFYNCKIQKVEHILNFTS